MTCTCVADHGLRHEEVRYRGQVKVVDFDHPVATLFSDDAYWIDGAISHVDISCQRAKQSLLMPTAALL